MLTFKGIAVRDTPSTSGLSSCSTLARRLDLMSTSVPVWKPLPSINLRTTRIAFRFLESRLDFPDLTRRVWLVCLLEKLKCDSIAKQIVRTLTNHIFTFY